MKQIINSTRLVKFVFMLNFVAFFKYCNLVREIKQNWAKNKFFAFSRSTKKAIISGFTRKRMITKSFYDLIDDKDV